MPASQAPTIAVEAVEVTGAFTHTRAVEDLVFLPSVLVPFLSTGLYMCAQSPMLPSPWDLHKSVRFLAGALPPFLFIAT